MKLLRKFLPFALVIVLTAKIFGGDKSFRINFSVYIENNSKTEEVDSELFSSTKTSITEISSIAEEVSDYHQKLMKEKKKNNKKHKKIKKKRISLADIHDDSSTEQRILAIYYFLLEEGFTPEAAAGVIGNVAVESTFDPSFESRSGYMGLFQWNTNSDGAYWWYAIEDWILEKGFDSYSFEGQLRAFIHGPKKGQWTKARLKKLKKMKDVHQATEFFAIYYEGCEGGEDETEYYDLGNCYQALNTRKDEAKIAYELCNEGKKVYDGEKPYNG